MNLTNYENYCSNSIYGNYMQSTNWAKVKSNWIPEYITVKDNSGNIVATMLILVKKIPFFNTAMLYAPRGPVCDMHDMKILSAVFEEVKRIAEKYHAYTLKIDPLIDENDMVAINNLISLGFVYHGEKRGYDNTQCRENYRIDINGRTSEEIFNSFKPKWRYNIRLSERKGCTCGFYGAEKLVDFESLMKQTSERDGFSMRSKEYFSRILKSFDGKAKLCMCYYNDIPLSGALLIYYAKTVSYVYGCSSNELRNYMPNYLMQWTMIKYAADTGCKTYDFCGIPYWYDKNHRNYGVYQFKSGFNGQIKTWAGEFDYTFRLRMTQLANVMMKVKSIA